MEYHTPTHSTRRGRQSLSYSSTPLYKVIMIFNTLMNIFASLLNESASQTPIRIVIFSYFLIAYFLVAIAVIAVSRCGSKLIPADHDSDQMKTSSCTKNVEAVLNFFFTDLSLTLAGELYLAGDNILIVYQSFDATVPIGDVTLKARDLRSYLVAISLAFMIIAQIGPFVASRITEYIEPLGKMTLVVDFENCESAQNNGIGFLENMRQVTLYIPPGHHTDWKTGKALILRQCHCDGEQQSSKIRLSNGSCDSHNVTVDVSFLGKSKDFVQMSEIRVDIAHTCPVTILGKNPQLTFKTNNLTKYALSADFQIQSDNKSDVDSMESQNFSFQVKYESKIASQHLIQACFSLLDYALIADALYTTMLDEITQQDDVKTGKNCPLAHQIVALILLGLIIITWLIVVTFILPIGFCCGRKKYFKLFFNPNKFEEIKKQIIETFSKLKLHKCRDQLSKVIPDGPFCNDCEACCKTVSILSLTIIIIIVVLVYTIVFLIHIFIVVMITSILIGVILIICHYCCSPCCQRLYVYLITPASVLIMTIYLPVYLIADNSWPWICYVDRAKWKLAGSFPLNVVATLISIVPLVYKVLTCTKPPNQPDEQIEEHDIVRHRSKPHAATADVELAKLN